MSKPDFSDARQKLARANEHIADVEARVATFLSADFYHIRFETIEQTGGVKVILDSLHEPDKRINGVIGDAVSNLRSVLDYIAVALVVPITGNSDGIYFPFAKDMKSFIGEVTKASLSVCGQVIQDFLISRVQAYENGHGHIFWALNKLRNIDKHRFLITTVSLAGIKISFKTSGGSTFTNMTIRVPASQSSTMIQAPYSNIQFIDDPTPILEVSFAEAIDVRSDSAVQFLRNVSSSLQSLLNELEEIV